MMEELFFGFPPLPDALGILAGLSDEQFEVLRKSIAGPKDFRRSFERCERLAAELGVSTRDAFNILSSLEFLYDNSRKWEASENSNHTHSALDQFLEFTGLGASLGKKFGNEIFKRLTIITASNPAIQRRRKIRKLKSGLLDTATGFASFVDVRPRFASDRSGIEEFIPITILRVELRTEHGPDKSCVFQLSTEGISKLRATLEDVEKKLKALQNDEHIKHRLVQGSEGNEASDD